MDKSQHLVEVTFALRFSTLLHSLCLSHGRIPYANNMHSLSWLSPPSNSFALFLGKWVWEMKGLRKEILNPRKNIVNN